VFGAAQSARLITLVAQLDELSDLSPLAGMLATPASCCAD